MNAPSLPMGPRRQQPQAVSAPSRPAPAWASHPRRGPGDERSAGLTTAWVPRSWQGPQEPVPHEPNCGSFPDVHNGDSRVHKAQTSVSWSASRQWSTCSSWTQTGNHPRNKIPAAAASATQLTRPILPTNQQCPRLEQAHWEARMLPTQSLPINADSECLQLRTK